MIGSNPGYPLKFFLLYNLSLTIVFLWYLNQLVLNKGLGVTDAQQNNVLHQSIEIGQPNILEPLGTTAKAKGKKDNLGDVWDGSRCKICNAKELWFSIKLYVTKKSFCCRIRRKMHKKYTKIDLHTKMPYLY